MFDGVAYSFALFRLDPRSVIILSQTLFNFNFFFFKITFSQEELLPFCLPAFFRSLSRSVFILP